MYIDITKRYAEYIKQFITVSNETDILCHALSKVADLIRPKSITEILHNLKLFNTMLQQIVKMIGPCSFCQRTRLFSNYIFQLIKDLIKIYKVYYIHIAEIFERFYTLEYEESRKCFKAYSNFLEINKVSQKQITKLLGMFKFPITQPEYYKPEAGLEESLKTFIEQAKKSKSEGNSGKVD